MQQLNWSAPLTNKLLVEVGIGYPNSLYGEPPTPEGRALVQVNEQGGAIPGLTYRARDFSINRGGLVRWIGSASYVTGAHNLKVGFDGERFYQVRAYSAQQDGLLQFRFNNGVPNRLTMGYNNWRYELVVPQQAVYVQDSSTFGRLTVHGGLRFDYAHSYAPEQKLFQQSFVPKEILYPETEIVKGFLDLSPRVGAAYDLRGDGKTSVKVSVGRYLAAVNADGIYASTAPVALIGGGGARTAPMTTRSWTDRNGNFVAGLRFDEQGHQRRMRTVGDPELRRAADERRRSHAHREQRHVVPPPLRLGLWPVRPARAAAASLGRSQLQQAVVGQPLGRRQPPVGPADYNAYSVRAPADPRLPDGGGYVISDLQDVTPAKFGATSNYEVYATNFGNDVRYFHAVDVNLRGQLRGVTLRVSTTTGRQVTDTCELIYDSPSLRNCHVALPFQMTFTRPRRVHRPEGGCPGQRGVPELAREPDLGEHRLYFAPRWRRAWGGRSREARPTSRSTCSIRARCIATGSTSSTSASRRRSGSAGSG